MTSVAVLIPVLNRPLNAAPVALSVRESDPRARPVFLCSENDAAEVEACLATGALVARVPWPAGPGDWARKLNYGFQLVQDEWLLLGADDLRFHPGWFDACLAAHNRYQACVIGTNDLGNPRTMVGHHSTHPLVHRDYWECGTVDSGDVVLHEGYDHQFVDDEFVQTAMARKTYRHARDAFVEHLHPNWRKATDDPTYQKGMAHLGEDSALFESRKHLWRDYLV